MDIDFNKINYLRKKIPDLKSKKINEAQTKEWLIRPFFEILGWDFSSPSDVCPEDDDTTGKKPDYVFLYNDKKMFIIEAKPLSNPLSDEKMIKEKINYCSNSGVPFLVITNGEVYKVFYTEIKGTGTDKLLYEFSITTDFNSNLIWKLSKKAAKKNELEIFAKNITKHLHIKAALEDLIQSGNSELVNLINQKIKSLLGFYLSDDEIISSLKNISFKINELELELPKKIEYEEEKVETLEKFVIDESEFKLEVPFGNGKHNKSLELFKKFIDKLSPKDFPLLKIKPRYSIVSFWKETINSRQRIAKVESAKESFRFYFNISKNQIPQKFEQLVHSGGDWDCIISVKSEEDINNALELLKITYQLNIPSQK